MLKNFFRAALLAVAAVCALASCGGNTADYDALRPTLLGGVYFYSDHDGVDAFDAQIKREALSKLEGYKEYFINPYKGQSVDSVVTMLRKDWGVTDSVGLKELLDTLKSSEGEHKAWDWCRAVNISWAGVRTGFITQAEAEAYQKELLALAQAKYPDWTAYFNDFLAGRTAWDPNDEYGTAEDIEKGVKELLENKASIYKVVPFK